MASMNSLRLVSACQSRPPDTTPSAEARLFSTAFEHAPVGMTLVDCDGQRLRVNAAFCRMLGYPEQELLQRRTQDITEAGEFAEDLRRRQAMLRGGPQTYQREKCYLHRDGHAVWGLLVCTLVRTEAGEPLHFIAQVQDITERKLAEQALRRSEERFRSLTLLSSDWYWEQDDELRFTEFSGHPVTGALRLDQVQALGKRRWELPFLHPISTSWAGHRATLAARLPFRNFEYARVLAHAPTSYLSASGEPVFDAQGGFVGYRGTARDITERVVAEQSFRDAQALLHMAARIGRLGGWGFVAGSAHVTWSNEVCAIHEVAPGFAPTPREAVVFFTPEYRQPVNRMIRICLTEGTGFDVEAQITTAQGRSAWVRVIGEAQRNAQGEITRIQGACQDISETKKAAQDARAMAMRLTNTLESLTDTFFTLDRKGQVTYLNAEAERLLRRSRANLLGRCLWEAIPQLVGSAFEAQYVRALTQNVVVQFDEYFAPFAIWVQVKAYPSEQGLAVYIKDVTQRVAAEHEILRLNADLEERVKQRTAELQAANKDLEAFAYSVAHDLRSPLGSIDGFSKKLQDDTSDGLSERNRHYLNRVRAGVRQMSELTDGLLTLASLSRTPLYHEEVDLTGIARQQSAMLRESAPQRQAEIRVQDGLKAQGDPRLLAQVMDNLLGNAWKFSARKKLACIEVGRLTDPQGETVYFVKDNGAGFDLAHSSQMFEAFHRMHSPLEFEGTGIGLALARKAVSRHGGRIWAEAAPEQGATFFFTVGATG
ncbi:MAG: PAS domain S-box protein, partial [Comamonadaceae bacterium]